MSEPSSEPSSEPQGSESAAAADRGDGRHRWWRRLILVVLALSLAANAVQYWLADRDRSAPEPREVFHSGDEDATAKIAVITIRGTIMPPFTGRVLATIKRIEKDDDVRGVLLSIDSPGGFVADSHQIYHRLVELRKKTGKPVWVSMSRMAASGGYYIAMGAGPEARVFAEPTTWTGSIGVIIPRYDMTRLGENVGITADPLKTGEFKDSLNPFRPLTPNERTVWAEILDDAFRRFVGVIADNRGELDEAAVRRLATGRIYTANQAIENGLVDEIGFEDDAIKALKESLELSKARVVTYRYSRGWLDLLLDAIELREPEHPWKTLLESTVPRAMYYCSWGPIGVGELRVGDDIGRGGR